MTLVRYNPLNDFVPGTFGDMLEGVLRDSHRNSFTPSVDIFKSEKEIELQLLVPGMTKEDFNIDLDKNKLTISGDRKLNEDAAKLVKRESNYGNFSRTFNLSEDVNLEKINASYENGILKITMPLIEKSDKKTIIKVK